MYQYSTIKQFYKEWANYVEEPISNDDASTLSFYAQQQYKRYYNNKLFDDYVEKDIDFKWNYISKKDTEFLKVVWETYKPLIEKGNINLYVANKKNYRLIEDLMKTK